MSIHVYNNDPMEAMEAKDNRITELEAQLAEAKKDTERLIDASRKAIEVFNNTSWGWDGDCCAGDGLDALEELLDTMKEEAMNK